MNMKISIRKWLVPLLWLCCLPMAAQLNGSGYYRLRNAANTTDYISLANDKFNYSTVIGTAGGGLRQFLFGYSSAVARAMTCARAYLRTDIHMVQDADLLNPSTVLYAEKRYPNNNNNNEYNLVGQSTSLRALVTGKYPGSQVFYFDNLYVTVQSTTLNGQTVYTARIPLKDESGTGDLGIQYFYENNGTFDIAESSNAQSAKWYIEPVTHFNVQPTVEHEGKYYCTMYTPFAYTLSGEVEKAYVVSEILNGGIVKKTCIAETGETVPAGTPVVLECGSNVASECNLIPTGVPLSCTPDREATSAPPGTTATNYTGTNLLKGTYFCNTDGNMTFNTTSGTNAGSFNANNNKAYTESQMRVFGVGSSSGKQGFYKFNGSTMNANKVWLDISSFSGTVDGFVYDDAAAEDLIVTENGETKSVRGTVKTIDNVEYITTATKTYEVTNKAGKLVGDLDNDGMITTDDVTILVNILLGLNTDYSKVLANVYDDDNEISSDDVTAMVNIILELANSKSIYTYDVEDVWIVGGTQDGKESQP